MKEYLQYGRTKTHYSLQHNFNLVFRRVELIIFTFLCIVLLITSKVNRELSKDISMKFVDVSLPVVKVASFPFNTAISLLTDFKELVEAKEQNKSLKEDNEKLKALYIKALEIYQENRSLRSSLSFVADKSSSFKAVRVIGRSNGLFNQILYVDAGKNRGLKEGSIVSGSHGVIGRVSDVGEDKSRLILLTDANSRIPVITSKARVRGILAGADNDLMEILYLQKNNPIQAGDLVFTSGDGDTLPSGLLVGMVKEADKDRVTVEMIESINNADFVTVLDY